MNTDAFVNPMFRVLMALLALVLALPIADVLCFVWLHAELPDECLASYWQCY